ncbi:hypothetical protein HAX54_012615, partial [Datura stramonium]|nr:hypothetical protein [Datura stramonium]
MEEQQSFVPEAHTQSHIVKFVQEVNKKDAESATPLDEEHQVIPEAQTQSEIAKSVQTESHNVKSIEAVDKQVPEPFTPMDDQHLVVHEAQYYIELMNSENAKVKQLMLEGLVWDKLFLREFVNLKSDLFDEKICHTDSKDVEGNVFTTDRPSYGNYVDEFRVIWKTK